MNVTHPPIKTRRDLIAYMHDVMASSTQEWRRERRQKAGEGRLKAYLLDAHVGDGDSQDAVLALLKRVCALNAEAAISETSDSLLFVITLGDEMLVVDAADPRFMIVHTAGRTESTDPFVVNAVEALPELDRAWLPSSFLLNSANHIGRLRRGTVRFDSNALMGRSRSFGVAPEELEDDSEDWDDLGPATRGKRLTFDLTDPSGARQALRELNNVDYFRHALALSRVDLLRHEQNGDGEMYSISRVFDWGKISCVGTSADSHLTVVVALRNRYRDGIEQIEREYCFRVEGDGAQRGRLYGHPISIRFHVPITDLGQFARRVFSNKRPFSLWGEPRLRSDHYATVHGLDLHVGARIYCEIMPDAMRVYLQQGACGNTIARLYTNLVRHYDASAEIVGRGTANALLQ